MEQWRCAVCGEPVDASNSAVCNGCGRRYHLNQRNDVPGKDCGHVWVNEWYLALEFACFNCLPNQASAPVERRRSRRPPGRETGTRRRYRRRA
jgi:hypothetical protein